MNVDLYKNIKKAQQIIAQNTKNLVFISTPRHNNSVFDKWIPNLMEVKAFYQKRGDILNIQFCENEEKKWIINTCAEDLRKRVTFFHMKENKIIDNYYGVQQDVLFVHKNGKDTLKFKSNVLLKLDKARRAWFILNKELGFN